MGYRPICDFWPLARTKVKYYGSYPGGFLERARALLGVHINDPVLHVCAGKVRDYPYRGGIGPNDRTLDLDPEMKPDYLRDAREPFPRPFPKSKRDANNWGAILADPPYTEADADHYAPGGKVLPTPIVILANALQVVPVGGRVGILHYVAPSPPKPADKTIKLIALAAVFTGYNNRIRVFSVYERRR